MRTAKTTLIICSIFVMFFQTSLLQAQHQMLYDPELKDLSTLDSLFLLKDTPRERLLEELKEALRPYFTGRFNNDRFVTFYWIGQKEQAGLLSVQEAEELDLYYIKLNPINDISEDIKRELAMSHLERRPREERVAIYMEAVAKGKVLVEGVAELDRISAVRLAAVEGIEEFAPLVEQYKDEINQRFSHAKYSDTDFMLELIKYRNGAKNRADALYLHAKRLAEMDSSQFFDSMEHSIVFREVTFYAIQQNCGRDNSIEERNDSAGCQEIFKAYEKQSGLEKQRIKENKASMAPSDESNVHQQLTWLDRMLDWTSSARSKLSEIRAKERAEKQKTKR